LTALLSSLEDSEVVGQATNGVEAISLADRFRPDLVLVDFSMEGTGGLSVIEEFKRRLPDTRLVVLSVHDSKDYILSVFRAGVDGYCLEDSGFEELIEVIRSVLAGKRHFCSALSDKILRHLRSGKRSKADLLTHREEQIMKLVAAGYKNEEIAHSLFISDKTVGKHKSNIIKKFGCRGSSDLVAFAMQNSSTEKKTTVQ
jgi:two-component system response regulator NreC